MRSSRKRRRESSESVAHPECSQGDEGGSQYEQRTLDAEVWDTFREEYVESVEQLPLSIHRNFALLKQLDAQANVLNTALLSKIKEYIRRRRLLGDAVSSSNLTNGSLSRGCGQTSRRTNVAVSGLPIAAQHDRPGSQQSRARGSPEHRIYNHGLLTDFSACSSELLHAMEEKVNLARATYDSVDRHVRLLDQAIKEHEIHSKEELTTAKINSPSFPISGLVMTRLKDHADGPLLSTPRNTRNRPERSLRTHSGRRTQRAPKLESSSPTVAEPFDGGFRGHVTDRVKASDMPIDPNEPRYCYCGQVSFGEMIACDAAGCEREWFHLNCVGLAEAPKRVKWYCDACKEGRRSSRLRRRRH